MAATTSTSLDDLFVNIIAQARFTAEEQSLMMGRFRRDLVDQYVEYVVCLMTGSTVARSNV